MEGVAPGGDERRRDLVRLSGRVVHRVMREEDPVQWHRLLSYAYLNGARGECLCRGNGHPLPMSVVKAGKSLTLRRMPYGGPDHHPGCDSHGPDIVGGGRTHALPAIRATEAGLIDVKIDAPMSSRVDDRGAASESNSASSRPTRLGMSRSEVTVLGFLHILWETAGLNRWHPETGVGGTRRLGAVHARLEEALGGMSVNGRPCTQTTFVPTAMMTADAMIQRAALMVQKYSALQEAAAQGEKPILLVIAEALRIFPGRYDIGLTVKGFPEAIWIRGDRYKRLSNSWPTEVRSLAPVEGRDPAPGKTMVIAGIQVSEKGKLNWVYGALMATNDNFIPVDSGHERAVADALIRQRREFAKPLRYTGNEATHPDFILTDTQPEVTMEVFGMDTPEYLHRKQQKVDYYRNEGRSLWVWNAAQTGEGMPAFPLATAAA